MKGNEKIIAGLKEVVAGLNNVISELSSEEVVSAPAEKVTKRVSKKSEPINPPTEAEATVSSECGYTKEELDKMKYNELKKLGSSMGVSCRGTRDEITARMLATSGEVTDSEEEAPAEEVKSKRGLSKKSDEKEDNKVVPINKKSLKKSAPAEAEEEEISAEFIEKAEAVMEETDIKDVIQSLKDVGVKVGNKKSEVTKVLAKALADGVIELDEEEDSDSEGDEITEETYFSQFDPDGVNDPSNMSEVRATAVAEMMKEAIEGVEDESLTEKDITNFLEELATEEEKELLGDEYEFEDLFGLYCEIKKHLIDDEGELHEGADPYEINEDNYCCGHILKYDKKSKTFICEVCGESYEVGE